MSNYKAQVNALLKQKGLDSLPSFSGPSSLSTDNGDSGNLLKVGGTLLLVIFIILIVLLVVHNTITPIFKVKRNGKGFIPIPGMGQADDGAVYWQKVPHPAVLDESKTIFDGPGTGSTVDFSFSVDFYFNDLNNGVNTNRVNRKLFCRYSPNDSTSSDPTKGLQYSIIMELDPQKNDMYITFRTENLIVVTLENIVPKTPIRVGVVVAENYVEVYRDGKLVKTVNINSTVRTWRGAFWGDPGGNPVINTSGTSNPSGTSADLFNSDPQADQPNQCPIVAAGPLGVVYNLHLWRRVVSPEDMRDALPRLLSSEDYAKKRLSESKLASGLNNYISDVSNTVRRNADAVYTALDDYGTRIGNAANALAGAP